VTVQTIWKGAISFGLVTIPVRLFAATEERDVAFRQVHEADGSRIRYRRVCEQEDREVPYGEIAKGYELPDGGMVVLTKEDFSSLPLPSTKAIEVLTFVPADQIDPIYYARSYYLKADGAGDKPYVLFREALVRSGQVALVKVALRNREALAALRERDGVLVMQTMLWPDEVRDAQTVAPPEEVEVRPQEIDMAQSYIETLSGDFAPEAYTDAYREALEELIQAKIAGRELVTPEQPAAKGKVIDLMSALRESVEQAKRERGAAAGTGGAAAESPAAEEAPAPKRATRSATRGGGTKGAAGQDSDGATRPASKKAAGAKGTKATSTKPGASGTAATKKGGKRTA
jgi:DNA end-binding protein Ku